MSGNNDGGSPTINRPDPEDSCQDLKIITNLASPQAEVISELTRGDILIIQALSDQGPIQAIDKNGRPAGTIISREQLRMLNCINQGTTFEAEVLLVEDGQCRIQIYAE